MNIDGSNSVDYFVTSPSYFTKIKETWSYLSNYFDGSEKESLSFPDPLYTLIQLGLIYEANSKIAIDGATIYIQKSTIFQPLNRWISGQNRNELKKIKYSILKAAEWYPVKDHSFLTMIYKRAIIGLLILRETYAGSDDFVEEGLDTYISVLSSTIGSENLPSEYVQYTKNLKLNGIFVYNHKFESYKGSSLIHEFSLALKRKMSSLWDCHTLISISNLFQKIQESKENTSKDEGIKAIQILIENSPKKFQKVLDDLHPLLKKKEEKK